jgi:hypothetical protein
MGSDSIFQEWLLGQTWRRPNSALQPTGSEAAVFSVCGSLTFGFPVTLSAGPAAELGRYVLNNGGDEL